MAEEMKDGKPMSKGKRRYSNPPKIGEKKMPAPKDAQGTPTADGEMKGKSEGAAPKTSEEAGTAGIPIETRHLGEREEMSKRHAKEVHQLHSRHADEHQSMIERHAKDFGAITDAAVPDGGAAA